MLRLEFGAMGCQMLVATENKSPKAKRRLNEVPRWFADWEQTLSRFRPDSELNKINQQAGSPVRVGPVIWEVMCAAMIAWRQSDGLVTPTVLPALERLGYVTSFQQIRGSVAIDELDSEPTCWTPSDIGFDETNREIRLPEDMRIDLGGVAKGWAAHRALQQLEDLGPVLVDAGGDIALSNSLSEGKPWVIGVNDPFNRGAHIEKLYVRKGGIATSGRDHRRWQQGGGWRHHLIDPRNGLPADTDLLSVTVVAETVTEAEMAAKSCTDLGQRNRARLAG